MGDPPNPQSAPPDNISQADAATEAAAREAAPASPGEARAEGQAEVRGGTREALAGLQKDVERLHQRVQEEGFDFAGLNDKAETLNDNAVFKQLKDGVNAWFEKNTCNAPENFQQDWRRAVTEVVVKEVNSYDWASGEMGVREVENLLQCLTDAKLKTQKGGTQSVGTFEQWFQTQHKDEFEKWKKEKDAAGQEAAKQKDVEAKKTQALSTKKAEVGGKISALETKVTALPVAIVPVALLAEIRGMKERIQTETDLAKLDAIAASGVGLEPEIAALEELKPLAEDADIPQETRDRILGELREGKKKPDEAKRELEQAKGNAQAALEATDTEDMPIVDQMEHWLDQMEEGAWKTTLSKLVGALALLGVALAKLPLIGSWARQNLISNKILAARGDQKAKIALKVEGEFRKFGLPRALANELGGRKTKEVVAMITDSTKLATVTTDPATQQKLGKLATELQARGGATQEASLFEFMGNNPNWSKVEYTAKSTPQEGTPAAGTQTPEAAKQEAIGKIFNGLSGDDRVALEGLKAKDAAAGTLPDSLKTNERAKKIAAKLKTNGGDKVTDVNMTVKQFIEANLDKDWTIA